MGTLPWPEDQPSTWDTLLLGGTIFPGLAKVTCKGGHKIDVKDAPGADGESTTLQGEKVKNGTIVIRVWQASQWSDLEDLITNVLEPAKGKKEPLFIAHAVTAARLVANIIIEDVDGPDFDDERRWMEVRCTWKQFKPPPPKPVTKTPAKAKDKADPNATPDDPNATPSPNGGGSMAKKNKRNAATTDPNEVPKNPRPSATPSFGEVQ